MPNWKLSDFIDQFKATRVVEGFNYSSGTNTEWLSVNALRKLIKENVEKDFELK